jgi:kinetochore protein NDC80
MNAEHEALSRNLEDLKQKISETQRSVMSLEVNVANRVATAEEALDTYNNLLSSVGLFPPLPPPFEDLDLTLELNPAATNPTQLLSGADIRKVIKPTLSRIAEQKRSQRADVESERIKIDNELDQVIAHCENLEEEINQTEKKVATINEQADDLREVTVLPLLFSARILIPDGTLA